MKFLLYAVAGLTLLTSCSSIPLIPGANRVRITKTEPQRCKFIGDITGNQGNFFTGQWTSNANLETGARNSLKNKAFQMGGNTVYMLTNRAGQTGDGYGLTASAQTNVVVSGSVYKCGGGNKSYDYDQPVGLSRSQIIVKKISKSRKKVLVSDVSGLESGETLSFNDKFGKACLAQVSRLLKKKKLAVLDVSSCRNRRLIKRGSVFQKNDEELDF